FVLRHAGAPPGHGRGRPPRLRRRGRSRGPGPAPGRGQGGGRQPRDRRRRPGGRAAGREPRLPRVRHKRGRRPSPPRPGRPTPRAVDVALEFGSLSKTYNMTGWRVGWAVGSPVAVEALGRVKTNIDSGIFNALQRAGIEALQGPQEAVAASCEVYRRRRDLLVDGLNAAGWVLSPPRAAIYVWAPTPDGESSGEFADFLLEAAGVVVAPGAGYGPHGEGYVRFSLTIDDGRLAEGVDRIAR